MPLKEKAKQTDVCSHALPKTNITLNQINKRV